MKTFVETFMGYDIYIWSTGKYEAYLDDVPIGIVSRNYYDIKDMIISV
jgi:hypothetical protein